MGFMDAYKHLEKICGEMLTDDRKVSAYIDEMISHPDASKYVKGWNEDLKQLKHYRWVRNQIAHEPGCTEANMCEKKDVVWLENFYFRITKQIDPLTLYYRALRKQQLSKPMRTIKQQNAVHHVQSKSNHGQMKNGIRYGLICFFVILAGIIAILLVLKWM